MSLRWKLVGARKRVRLAVLRVRWRRRGAAIGLACEIAIPDVVQQARRMTFGDAVKMRSGGRLEAIGVGTITIGARTEIEAGVHIGAAADLRIGPDTVIASSVTIIDHDHGLPDGRTSVLRMPLTIAPIEIGRGVWIGEKATVLKGVRIGDGAVIGAHAVVTSDVPSGGVAVGVPARTIRVRDLSPRPQCE